MEKKNGNTISADTFVQYDSTSGYLTIPDFTKREEGNYMCVASTAFDNQVGRVIASSLSPPIKLLQTRVEKFADANPTTTGVSEYGYAKLLCSNKGEVVGSDINTNWYESENSKDVNMDGGRLFVDSFGDLHFSYALSKDNTASFKYLCGISSTSDKLIRLGNLNSLIVTPVPNPTAIRPQLQYSNTGVKGLRFSKVKLECVFSGYDTSPPHIPETLWFDDAGKEIVATEKYTFSDDRRILYVNIVQESDERTFFVKAETRLE
uniref:Ig-like domain-containing protein n=1 Tax=Arion vulgaris TaxID=1028688 RepID=A0A0B7B2T8_9EUPU